MLQRTIKWYESPLNLKSKQLSQLVLSKHSSSSSPFGETDDIPTSSGISRPLAEILKQLNKKVPDSLVRQRIDDGFSTKYMPWHVVNRIMNLHAPEWSGEVRSITYSSDGKSVSVVYRVTLYGTDAESWLIENVLMLKHFVTFLRMGEVRGLFGGTNLFSC
ncbi:DNA repair RAD52-like protein 1, mitochondrial isoform X2 [Mercurialis annua]|uniref:DNA repair RAD52-like protein 1, mitochondrial isoform X2 n=1 Tax=Mercurialis annua TaxID=3986 RepID=UPI00215EBCEC|nr:DNA repair RAD52-like protein 1, mitochondrial isoform X2 [Mercurialis annua]